MAMASTRSWSRSARIERWASTSYRGDLDAELSDVEGGLSQTPCQSKSKKAAGSWGAMTTILTFHPAYRIK
jgi:hypothetical protein